MNVMGHLFFLMGAWTTLKVSETRRRAFIVLTAAHNRIVEDPFSVLSSLVPDPPSRPLLVPLYPPLFNPPPPPSVFDPSSSQTPQPQPLVPSSSTTFPCPIILPPEHTSPVFPLFQSARSSSSQPQPRRHWVINRAATTRQKGKEKDDELEGSELPAWQVPRDPNSIDFGSFAVLSGALAEEMRQRGLTSTTPGVAAALNETVDQEVNLDLIRRSLDCNSATVKTDVADSAVGLVQTLKASNLLANEYWTANRAIEGEDYVRDVVYGGVDGFAYVRSLAEFVDGNCYHIEVRLSRLRITIGVLFNLGNARTTNNPALSNWSGYTAFAMGR